MVQQMDNLKISAQKRGGIGSRQSKQLRKEGWLPCVVYDSSGNSFPIQIKRHNFELFLRNRGKQNFILDLDIEGDKARKVLLKDTQRNHINDHLLHADFLEVSMTRKLKVSVPVRLVGESIGVTQQEGIMEQQLRSVEVECLPGDIISEFMLDISNLSIGDNLCVRDIKTDPTKITILTAPEITVVSVQLPHIEEEKPAEEAAVEGAVEGQPPAEGAEAAAAATAEPGKDTKEKGKETKEKGKEGKEAAPAEKDKESKEKGKEPKEKGKAPKDKKK